MPIRSFYTGFSERKSSPVAVNDSNEQPKAFFQPKLSINNPNDVYEQEADAMADHVMGQDSNHQKNTFFKPSVSAIQRKCATCEEEDKKTQLKEANANGGEASPQTENYISTLSGGNALAEKDKTFFESKMGYDFSGVRVHTDNMAVKSANDVNALAYTSGNNIVFNQNQYAPDTDSGKRLLAHELTHVVQQNSGDIQTKLIQRDPPSAGSTPSPAPSPVPAGPAPPSPSLSMSGLTTFVFRYGDFNARLSLPNSIQASLPVRIRNIGTLTFTATSTIPTQFGLSVSLDTANHIRIAGNVAYNADTGVGTAGLSVTQTQQVCTMRDPEATRTRLNTLTNNVKSAVQAFNVDDIQSIIALGSAIYSLYDAAHDATDRCYMQPLWSIGLGAHTPVNPLAANPPAQGTDAGSSYIGLTATWHF